MLSKLTFGEHATENARKFMRDGAHPSVHDIAFVDRDGFAYSWDMVTPKSVLVKMLLLRTRPSPSPVDGFARAAGHTGLRMEPRVTIADEAFAWADSGRANCILFRLVDSGHVDIASYALKFLTS